MGGARVRGRVGAAVSHLPGVTFALLLWLVSVAPLSALEVLRVEGSEIGCTHLLRGTLTPGATDGLRDRLTGAQRNADAGAHRICLDSPGGSFAEGVRLARFLAGLSTGVDAGHRCESACFLAFMAGSFNRQEDRLIIPDRVMHPRARLGFHAPSIPTETRMFRPEEVTSAWKTALEAVAELIRLRLDEPDYAFRDVLLDRLLRTGGDEMTYIETVGDAALYNITVFPVLLPFGDQMARQEPIRAEDPAFGHVCRALGLMAEDFGIDDGPADPSLSAEDHDRIGFLGHFNPGESSTKCLLSYYYHEDYLNSGSYSWWQMNWSLGMMSADDWWIPPNDFEIAAYMHYPAAMRIADLPIAPDHRAQNRAMLEHLHSSARAAQQVTCGLTATARVINVQEYVNIREAAGFQHPVVVQAPRASLLRPVTPGVFRATEACLALCRAPRDRQDGIGQCIEENQVWLEVADDRGHRGWVSQRFLQPVE